MIGQTKILIHTYRLLFTVLFSLLLFNSCDRNNNVQQILSQNKSLWYRQAIVDLGSQIVMFSLYDGLAISRGTGKEISGKAYRFINGHWISFYEFPYSDYPLITRMDTATIWTVNHLTHDGAYKPILKEFKNEKSRIIELPTIMWDDIDYVMFKGLQSFTNDEAWLIGQQGHILFYDGHKWNDIENPLRDKSRSSLNEGDLNDIDMTSSHSGWAVGRGGVILRCKNNKWDLITSPTKNTLQKISMLNDSTGWAVGDNGTILECKNYLWGKVSSDIREQLNSVFVSDGSHAWIVGNNSLILEYDGKKWMQDYSIKNYDDSFSDISVVKDASGNFHTWIIGNQGIYTNSQSIGFSFTDITNASGLRRSGKLGLFLHRSSVEYPDLIIANDGGSNLLFQNYGNHQFSDVTSETALRDAPRDPIVMALGDVNNDGNMDILEIFDRQKFQLYFGTVSGSFFDATEKSGLYFDDIDVNGALAAKFIDLDNDGDLDLYLSNCNLPDQIFTNNGAGKFLHIRVDSGIKKILNHSSYGAAFGDFNNDGLIDILIPYYMSYKHKFFTLALNLGGMKFTEADDSNFFSRIDLSPSALLTSDFNNDGNIDVYIHSQKIPPILWLNDGKAHFTNASSSAGLTSVFIHPEPINGIIAAEDVNNDGWLDVFDGSKLLLNSPHLIFSEVSERTGIQFIGTPTFSDTDNDGDMDLFIGSGRGSLGKGDRAALFRNNLNDSNWIKVRVCGDKSNRNAIGAKVILQDNEGRKQFRWIGCGANQLESQIVGEVHFGTSGKGLFTVEVEFPSGITTRLPNIHCASRVTVHESNFIQRSFLLARNSIFRTILFLNPPIEIIKVFVLILIIGCSILFGRKIGAGKFVSRWQFHFVVILVYLILLHLSINENIFTAASITFLPLVVAVAMSIIIARVVIRNREAQHISHYKILKLLGTGGMGKVYQAVDTTTKELVAIKILNSELLKDSENRRRLSAEGHVLASFTHPNIVKVFEIGETDEQGFIVMELLSGGTLKEKLEKAYPLAVPEIIRYILQVCEGLIEVHSKNIVHRDLKTGNLMLDSEGNIRIMDFGLSKSPLVTTMTTLGTVLGTLGYVAPEQVTSLNVDKRTDIFSLGVIMYELLTHQLPFKGENEIALIHSIFNTIPVVPSVLRDGISKQWDEIIMKCLEKDIERRYQCVQEIKEKILSMV